MLALIKKEISNFFSGPIGYLVVAVFLTINGLFLWVFGGEYNIFDAGFADLNAYFELAPWVLLFLIPAVTMRSISEERKTATLELLFTKPISLKNLVFGKYLGVLSLILIAILPTLLYIVTISSLSNPSGQWDTGSTLGSFIGLLFLAMSFTAIGLWTSSVTSNQIVAFIYGVFLCFLLYFGFDGLSTLSTNWELEQLGMRYHYNNVSRGVLDSRDLVYFLSLSFLFLTLTLVQLKSLKS